MKNLPIACSLATDALHRQRCEFHRIESIATDTEMTGAGLRARFEARPGLLPEIARFIEQERQCCRFLEFRLTTEQDGGPIWLDVSGPPGTAEFLQETLGGGTHDESR